VRYLVSSHSPLPVKQCWQAVEGFSIHRVPECLSLRWNWVRFRQPVAWRAGTITLFVVPARQESTPWNRLLVSLNVYKFGLSRIEGRAMRVQEVSKIIRMGLQEGAKHCLGDCVKTTHCKIHWPRNLYCTSL